MTAPKAGYDAKGAYFTPDALATAIVARAVESLEVAWPHTRPCGRFLEPSAGGGAFVRALLRTPEVSDVWAIDADMKAPALQIADPRLTCRAADFLTWEGPTPFPDRGIAMHGSPPYGVGRPTITIGNPPYGIAETRKDAKGRVILDKKTRTPKLFRRAVYAAHIQRALELSDAAFLLLRLNILCAKRNRAIFGRGSGLCEVWPVNPRPCFNDRSTSDNSEYAVFFWRRGHTGWATIRHLDWEKK